MERGTKDRRGTKQEIGLRVVVPLEGSLFLNTTYAIGVSKKEVVHAILDFFPAQVSSQSA